MDVGKTKDLIIDLHNASGGGEGLAGNDLTADAGRCGPGWHAPGS